MKKNRSDIAVNIIIILLTAVSLAYYYVCGPDAVGVGRDDMYKFFTTDSNILVAVSSVVILVFELRRIKNPETTVPKWASLLRLAGVAAVTVTILTVLLFLTAYDYVTGGPQLAIALYQGPCLIMHIATPILSIVSFTVLEKELVIENRESVYGMLPTIIYSIIYIIMVMIVRSWDDWYGFTFNGQIYMIPISIAAMYGATDVISLGLLKLHNKK